MSIRLAEWDELSDISVPKLGHIAVAVSLRRDFERLLKYTAAAAHRYDKESAAVQVSAFCCKCCC